MASAFGMYLLSGLTALLILGTLGLHHVPGWGRFVKKHHVRTDVSEDES
jgi:putative Mg2+ transporter-C (MgtC) family protein